MENSIFVLIQSFMLRCSLYIIFIRITSTITGDQTPVVHFVIMKRSWIKLHNQNGDFKSYLFYEQKEQ